MLIGTPKRDVGGVRAGEDLGGKGVVELAWDLYVDLPVASGGFFMER